MTPTLRREKVADIWHRFVLFLGLLRFCLWVSKKYAERRAGPGATINRRVKGGDALDLCATTVGTWICQSNFLLLVRLMVVTRPLNAHAPGCLQEKYAFGKTVCISENFRHHSWTNDHLRMTTVKWIIRRREKDQTSLLARDLFRRILPQPGIYRACLETFLPRKD